jgi:copper chaperone
MEKLTLHVLGMSCQHCVKAITKAVGELPGVANVSVDLAAKTATVEYDSAQCSVETIRQEIEDQGYDIAD